MVNEEVKNRKGARKVKDIPDEVLRLLNRGIIPTVNLTEWLAINQIELSKNTFKKLGLKKCIPIIEKAISQQKKSSTMSSIKLIGGILYDFCQEAKTLSKTIKLLSSHESDTIRCYATYLIALDEDLSVFDKLDQSRNLIADDHFGVREIVWMALRPVIEKNLTVSLELLGEWARNDSHEYLRRFTTESTRPRGVWCKHIDSLKEKPEQALPILEALKSDSSKYVQDSVGNWLNDASKSRPEFVISLCKQWGNSATNETRKIIKRALRTIEK